MPIREGTFYSPWPVLSGKSLNLQWGEIRSNQAELKAIARNSVQELETGVDELNALRALLGQAYGDLTFRNKYRFFYDSVTFELCCQKNDGTVDSPTWTDVWCVRFTDGQFQVVSQGGIQSAAGFYGAGLQSIREVAESGSAADKSILNPTKIFFNADEGLEVREITSGANAGAPEIRFTQPFGQAEAFSATGREWSIDHNFGISPVIVQVMDSDDRVVIPDRADVSDPNTAHFYFSDVFSGTVYIASGGLGAESLIPRDPFYLVVRTDLQASDSHLLKPNAELIFDSTQFYVNVDLDTDTGGANKTAFVSLTSGASNMVDHGGLLGLADDDHTQYAILDGSRATTFQGHVRMDDSLNVENVVTAEAFYLHTGSGGEISKSGNDIVIKTTSGQVHIQDELLIDGKCVAENFYTAAGAPVGGTNDHGSLNGLTGTDDHTQYAILDGSRDTTFQAHVRFDDTINVENAVTAEAFYVSGSANEINDTQFLAEDGAVGAPAYAFASDPTSGVFLDGSGNLNLVRAGVAELVVFAGVTSSPTNVVAIPNGSVSAPGLRSAGSSDTGLYFESETVSLSANGTRVANFGDDGAVFDDKVKAEAFYLAAGGDLSSEVPDAVTVGGQVGFIVPRLTTTERDALTPTSGMMIYNSTNNEFQAHENGLWVTMSSANTVSTQPTVEVDTGNNTTIDFNTGNSFNVRLRSNTTIKATNVPKDARSTTASIITEQPSVGFYNITWSADYLWPLTQLGDRGGPNATLAENCIDVFSVVSFYSLNQGEKLLGVSVLNFY